MISRFAVSPEQTEQFIASGQELLELITAQSGCRSANLSRAVDDQTRFILSAEFDSVSAYRKIMSHFDIRQKAIPFLAQAQIDEPLAYEPLLEVADGSTTRHVSLVAAKPRGETDA